MVSQGEHPSEQSPPYEETTLPSRRWNDFIDNCLVAPNEGISLSDHSPEKILVFTRQTLRPKRLSFFRKKLAPQKHVTCSAMTPVKNRPGRMHWPVVKATPNDPLWRIRFEVRFHRPKYSINLVLSNCVEQS